VGKIDQVKAVAEHIRALRERLGMTQTAFARELLTQPSTVSKWESGYNRPSPDVFVRLAKLTDEADKFYFLEEAGVPAAYFYGEKMAPEILRASTEVVARSLSTSSTFASINETNDVCTIPLLERPTELGNSNAMVSCTLSFPAAWLPQDATLQAVMLSNQISPFFEGEVIALVDISRRDPDRLQGCIVAVRTPDGIEPMVLRKDSSIYFLAPLHDGINHPTRVLRANGDWSVVGKILKWIGDSPGPTVIEAPRNRVKPKGRR
jgi:transcriptional regulator with XRE-family HTH domain